MDVQSLGAAIARISKKIGENKGYLIQLDQINGDGDLGISMSDGFHAVETLMEISDEQDLGRLLMKAGNVFNEAAPSSLGTILSFGFMGMAKHLKGKLSATPQETGEALAAGVGKIMEKAGSKQGERTILDSLCPAVAAYQNAVEDAGMETKTAWDIAAVRAAEGAEGTRQMKPVHGRAAYYGEKSLGTLDGGAIVGKLIFEAIAQR